MDLVVKNYRGALTNEITDESSFLSRKMLNMNDQIARALFHVWYRHYRRCRRDDRNEKIVDYECKFAQIYVPRIDMNLYRIALLGLQENPILTKSNENIVTNVVNNESSIPIQNVKKFYDDTSILLQMISIVMQDVQQRNLNAKHNANNRNNPHSSKASKIIISNSSVIKTIDEKNDENCDENGEKDNDKDDDDDDSNIRSFDHGEIPDNIYIGLNRRENNWKFVAR